MKINRLWQINFSVMYIHVALFYKHLLAYFHIKIFVRVLEAKSILHVFLANILFCQSSQLDDVVLSRNTNRFGHEEPNDFPSVTLSYTLMEENFISFLQSIIPLM